MNSSTKKSSIPRATHDCDRLNATNSRLRGPKPPVPKPPAQNHSHHSKPAPNDGLLKEDKDTVRRSLLELEADHARMKQTLEDTVREAEERLAAMERLMAERERLCSANLNAAAGRTTALEEQVEGYEKTLIENNIDPVTGAVTEPTDEQSAAVEKQKKVTKKDISKMREKLNQMNENSDKYLADIQNILQDIEELEATSQRVSNTAHMENISDSDMKALIHEVEEAQKKEEEEKKKQKKDESTEDDEEEEEEDRDLSSEQDEKENSQLPTKSEVFVTQKR